MGNAIRIGKIGLLGILFAGTSPAQPSTAMSCYVCRPNYQCSENGTTLCRTNCGLKYSGQCLTGFIATDFCGSPNANVYLCGVY